MKKRYLLLLAVVLLLINSPTYGALLENIPSGTGDGFVSILVDQGASSTRIAIGTDQWVGVGDTIRKVDALATEDAVLLFTVGSTTDATWLSDSSAWTVSSSTYTYPNEYVTIMTRSVGGAIVTVKSTTTLNAAPNTTINEKYEISVTGAALSDVKLFTYNDFNLDLGGGDRAYAAGDSLNPLGYDVEDYTYVTGTPGSGLTLLAYDSFVSSGGVPAPPSGQIDVSIGMKEITTVSKWEVNEFSTLSDKLWDLVNSISTDLDLLDSDATGGALKDNEYAFQYNIGALGIGNTATVMYDKIVNPVPEPATLLLVGMGLLGLGILKRKK